MRLAHNEGDATTEPDREAAHFLKLDGARIGRDLEVYSFMAEIQQGWQPVLPDVALEIVLPLRGTLPGAYEAGKEALLGMGGAIYDAGQREAWADIFAEPVAPVP